MTVLGINLDYFFWLWKFEYDVLKTIAQAVYLVLSFMVLIEAYRYWRWKRRGGK